jgi:hypothetical protein
MGLHFRHILLIVLKTFQLSVGKYSLYPECRRNGLRIKSVQYYLTVVANALVHSLPRTIITAKRHLYPTLQISACALFSFDIFSVLIYLNARARHLCFLLKLPFSRSRANNIANTVNVLTKNCIRSEHT